MLDLLILPEPGYTREVGRLISMLQYARATTLHAVRSLSTEQLDHRQDAASNSIGMLLAHIAAAEWVYQLATFDNRSPTADELHEHGAALDLGPAAWSTIRGRPLSFYVDRLGEVRARTLEWFRTVDDSWLDRQEIGEGGQVANHYWQWFHVCEDELSHRGQIRWLRSRLPP